MLVRIDSLPDYSKEYENVTNDKELHEVNAKRIVDLQAELFKLWTYIIKADKKNITVLDLRDEKSKKKYDQYLEK